jgi:C1A family cysteine protease
MLLSLYMVAGVPVATSSLYDTYDTADQHPHFQRFWNWIQEHRIVPKSVEQVNHMFDNWVDNDMFIDNINNKSLTYKLGHNIYSAMNLDEFGQVMQFNSNSKFFSKTELESDLPRNYILNEINSTELPPSVDWRTKGVVTPVKNQGQCGSCYSFSNTGALEGIFAIRYGQLESFSEQQIVDCSLRSEGGPNMGCNGGQISKTMDWIGKIGGLCNETHYPYSSGTSQSSGKCSSCTLVPNSQVRSHVDVQPSDSAMMIALTQQPVSVAVEADQRAFQLYSSGVFTESCGTNLDHAVLLVGYGTDSSSKQDYYILKNSWGTTWGDQGYMYIGKGSQYNGGKGQCGVLMSGAYPTL